jgi:hypothetical protein
VKHLYGRAGFTALWISLSVWHPAPAAEAPGRAKAGNRASGLTVEDVIKLAKAGLSEDIIVQQIKRKGQAFDLSSDQIIGLKAANVSDRIVEVMLDPPKADAPAPVLSAAAPAPAPVPPPAPPVRAEAPPVLSAPEPTLPTEVGVYAKKQDQWIEVSPEIVYWKTAGALKTIATAGIRHGDINGHVPGPGSHTSFAAPLEFLIVAPEGVALAEYRLLRLRRNKDNREFRTVTGGLLHSQSGEFRDMLTFDGKKVASHVYAVNFPSTAGPGEYGLLPPSSTNGSGKIYSFRVAE